MYIYIYERLALTLTATTPTPRQTREQISRAHISVSLCQYELLRVSCCLCGGGRGGRCFVGVNLSSSPLAIS